MNKPRNETCQLAFIDSSDVTVYWLKGWPDEELRVGLSRRAWRDLVANSRGQSSRSTTATKFTTQSWGSSENVKMHSAYVFAAKRLPRRWYLGIEDVHLRREVRLC